MNPQETNIVIILNACCCFLVGPLGHQQGEGQQEGCYSWVTVSGGHHCVWLYCVVVRPRLRQCLEMSQ